MTVFPERQELVKDSKMARIAGARVARACAKVGLSMRTYDVSTCLSAFETMAARVGVDFVAVQAL